ncbi:MAG TPA: hypothetical protein VJ227_04480 [Patescibacteria group bacterium]|nr:hypothetical protein [Patescibacteria group bacterium]
MKSEEHLEELKKEYEKTKATLHLKSSGWEELRARIGLLEPEPVAPWWKTYALAFSLVALLTGSLIGAYRISLASMPGDALYPVKILSERLIQNATGDNQIAIDHRADEIIILSEKEKTDREMLMKVVIEYKEVVEEKKSEIQESGADNQEFQRRLDDHHRRFDEAERKNPRIEDEIKEAQEASDRDEEED